MRRLVLTLALVGAGFAFAAKNGDWGVGKDYHVDWEARGGRITVTKGQMGENDFRGGEHQQGIACSDDAIFFGASCTLGKLDWKGNPVKVRKVAEHMGDVAWYKGRLYATWGRTERVKGVPGKKRSMVIAVFDENLELIGEHEIKDIAGIDGVTVMDDIIYFGAGADEGRDFHRTNRIGRMTLDFKFLGWKTVDIGVDVNYGVQNMVAADGKVYCFFYTHLGDRKGSPVTCGVFDRELNLLATKRAFSGQGIDVAPKRLQTVPGKTVFLTGGSCHLKPDSKPEAVRLHYQLKTLRD